MLISNCLFYHCITVELKDFDVSVGGGIFLYCEGSGTEVQIKDENRFENCYTTYRGGGLHVNILDEALFQLSGTCLFKNCSGNYGGGLLLECIDIKSKVILNAELTFENCSCLFQGGGLLLNVVNGATAEITKIKCINCTSEQYISNKTG